MIGPFFEEELGFELSSLLPTMRFVASYFGMEFTFEQPDQGTILAQGMYNRTKPEECCIQEYLGLQTFNPHMCEYVNWLQSARLQVQA